MQRIEKWEIFEISVKGKTEGNPFTDYTVRGTFSNEKEIKYLKRTRNRRRLVRLVTWMRKS